MKKLSEIISKIKVVDLIGSMEVKVNGIAIDSRAVESGFAFVAMKGTAVDGHQFIDKAVEKGATVVFYSDEVFSPKEEVTYVKVSDTSIACGEICSVFFDFPSKKMSVVGITGTNGKTTTATLLYRLMNQLGHKSGLISTISYEFPGFVENATHTTPDAVKLNRIFAHMVENECEYVFMEVSSHAVVQNRIAGIHFAGGVFSNITQDHLDFHKTFSEYIRAKKQFFDHLPAESFALANTDDPNGNVMLQNTAAKKFHYALNRPADFKCKIIENSIHGLHLDLNGTQAWFRLIGRFNAYNLSAVFATAILLGFEREEVLQTLSGLETVTGRFDIVRSGDGITAVIDYAHTPDALKKILETLRETRSGETRIITVAGAGGDRDRTKRPIMGKVMATLSDFAIITSDNPRSEDPHSIVDEVAADIDITKIRKVLKIVDRREAIKTAVAMAQKGDIILIAGKGHETYQEIKGIRHHFNDKEIVQEIFNL